MKIENSANLQIQNLCKKYQGISELDINKTCEKALSLIGNIPLTKEMKTNKNYLIKIYEKYIKIKSGMEFIIDAKSISSNKSYAGLHWAVRKKIADQWHALIIYTIKPGFGIKKYEHPVSITMSFNDRLDIDNHSFMAKLIIDGLRKCGVLVDDTRKYIKRLTLEFWDGKGIKVRLDEYKAEEE